MLRTQIYSSPDWAAELEAQWKDLVPYAPTATPFQSWEWQSTWWRHYAKTKRPHIYALYEGDELVGLAPFMISRGPWRTLRAMASGASDYLHPLVREGYEPLFAESLAGHLCEIEDVDLIDMHQIRENMPLARCFPACADAPIHQVPPRLAHAGVSEGMPEGTLHKSRVLHQATCLVLDLPATFEQYLQTLNKSLRYDVRKLEKELFKSGKARIEQVTGENLDQGLQWFFETHRKRWRKRGLPGAFVGGRSERFHREWAELAQASGMLWLHLLFHEDKPVGSIYAMRLGKTCFYYQAGFDPEASSISPGSLLVGYTIRRAIEQGVTTFDFLRGDEPYKRRWKPQQEYRNLRFIAPATGLMGKIGKAWNDAGSRVESRVRARLEGRGLY